MASSIAGVGSKGSSNLTSFRKINSRSSSDSFGNSAIISWTLMFALGEQFPFFACKRQSRRSNVESKKRTRYMSRFIALSGQVLDNQIEVLNE
jgi:hypothetical protein